MSNPEYQKPSVPLFPIFSLSALFPPISKRHPSILDVGSTISVTTGRMGWALALESIGMIPGDKVLVPSYHCNSMVEPIVHASATPVFYQVNKEASIDLADIRSRLDPQTRVLLVTNYFGFPQNLVEIREFCDKHNLILVEDCAHVFFGSYAGQPIGSYGDYAFASPMKFFATYDGGYLVSRRRPIKHIALKSPGWLFSVRGVATIIGRAVDGKRLGILRPLAAFPFWLKKQLTGLSRQPATTGSKPMVARPTYCFDGYFSGMEGEFDPAWIHVQMSRISRFIIAISSKSRAYDKRRENYGILLEKLSGLPGCRPLFPQLPDSVSPYVFPLLMENPERVFPLLKRQGVPISRFGEHLWRGMDPTEYPDAVELSRRVFQFPCHQELKRTELDWIIDRIHLALAA